MIDKKIERFRDEIMEDAKSVTSQQYVTFSLGDELFGVEVIRAREILSVTPVTKVPQTPDYLLGVINLRGSRYALEAGSAGQ